MTMTELHDMAFQMNISQLQIAVSTLESNIIPYLDGNTDDDHNNHLQELCLKTVQRLMSRCAHLGSVEGAEIAELLLRMVLNHDSKSSDEIPATNDVAGIILRPTKQMFTIAMEAWANVILPSKPKQRPNPHSIVPAERASLILNYMWEEYYQQEKHLAMKPDAIHYTTVIQAYANSMSKKGVHDALDLLEKLEQQSGMNHSSWKHTEKATQLSLTSLDPNLVPDRTCYNTILYCLSRYHRCRDDVASNKTLSSSQINDLMMQVMKKMENIAKFLRDETWRPNTRSYNLLLMAQTDGKYAENILLEMLNMAEARFMCKNDRDGIDKDYVWTQDANVLQENSVLPNVKSYNAVLNITHPQRAQEILIAMLLESDIPLSSQDRSVTRHPILNHIFPDTVSFNTCINAWAKSGLPDSGEKAENLLNFMEGGPKILLGISSNKKMKGHHHNQQLPDERTYNMVMKAWGTLGNVEGAKRVDHIIRRMLNKSIDNQDSIVIPSRISFTTALNAWAHSKSHDCGTRAQAVYDLMTLPPDEACNNALILAWCNQVNLTCDTESYRNAVSAVRGMIESSAIIDTSRLNVLLSIPSQINATSNLSRYDMACEAHRLLLDIMTGDFRPGILDVYSFNYIIKAFLDLKEEQFQSGALFAAIDTFNALCEKDNIAPTSQTYITMFKVLQQYLETDSAVRSTIAEELFRKCCESGLLTNAVVRIVETIFPTKSLARIDACRTNNEKTPLTVYDLPSEWSANRRVGQNQTKSRKTG